MPPPRKKESKMPPKVRRMPPDSTVLAYLSNGDMVRIELRDMAAIDYGDAKSGIPAPMRRDTAANCERFVGNEGEALVDFENKTLRMYDGKTAGGFRLVAFHELRDGNGKLITDNLAKRIRKVEVVGDKMIERFLVVEGRVNSNLTRRVAVDLSSNAAWDGATSKSGNLNGRSTLVQCPLPLQNGEVLGYIGFNAYLNGGKGEMVVTVAEYELGTFENKIGSPAKSKLISSVKTTVTENGAYCLKLDTPVTARADCQYILSLRVSKDSRGTVFTISFPWIQKTTL